MTEGTRVFRPVEIQLGSSVFYAAPGSRLTVPFVLINHSVQEGYFNIQVQGVPAEWVLLDIPVLFVGPNERREASFEIQAPQTSPVSEGKYPVTLSAVNQEDGQQRADVQFELNIGTNTATQPVSAFQAGDQVGVRMDTLNYTVTPGDSLGIPVVIANRGVSEDVFTLSLEGLPPSWVSIPEQVVRLRPSEQREVNLFLQPPQGPAGRAGRHAFRVRVTSQNDPSQITVVDGLLTVAAVSQFMSDLTPRHIDAGRMSRLRIHNQSNMPETFTIQFQTQGDDLEFVPSRSGPVNANPGETVAVDFAVSPRSPNWFGHPVTVPYSVIVRSSLGEVQAHSGDVISRALIPVWVLPVLLTLCLTGVCGLGLLWNWNQNRLTDATRTAQAVAGLAAVQTATAQSAVQTATAASLGIAATGPTVTAVSAPSPTIVSTATAAPANTATAVTPTFTPITPTNTFTSEPPTPTLTAPPPTATATLPRPTATNTLLPPTATATTAPTATMTTAPTATVAATAPATAATTATAATAAATSARTSTRFPIPATGQSPILFVSNRDGNPQLYLISPLTGGVTRLTNDASTDGQPAWSPDGKQIAFVSNRDGNNEVYVMNSDGSGQTNLTKNAGDDSQPAWSPDGKQIAFVSNRDGNNEVYVMNADGSSPANLTKNAANDFKPAWYTQKGLLTSTSRILFTTDRDGNQEIYSINPDGSSPVNLTKNPANDSLPAVPFAGGPVAFVSDRDGNHEIYVMGTDGSNPTNLTKNPADDTQPAWSQDGKWIVFATDRDGNQEIYLMAADGSQVTNLSSSPAVDFLPAWR